MEDEMRSAPWPHLLRSDIELAAAVVVDAWSDYTASRSTQDFEIAEVAIKNLRNTIRERRAKRGVRRAQARS